MRVLSLAISIGITTFSSLSIVSCKSDSKPESSTLSEEESSDLSLRGGKRKRKFPDFGEVVLIRPDSSQTVFRAISAAVRAVDKAGSVIMVGAGKYKEVVNLRGHRDLQISCDNDAQFSKTEVGAFRISKSRNVEIDNCKVDPSIISKSKRKHDDDDDDHSYAHRSFAAIHLDRGNKDVVIVNTYVTGSRKAGILVESGNEAISVLESIVSNNHGDGIVFRKDTIGPHTLRLNKIFENGENGVLIFERRNKSVAFSLVENLIQGNGTRKKRNFRNGYGIKLDKPARGRRGRRTVPANINLVSNFITNNNGKIRDGFASIDLFGVGQLLDGEDQDNLTTSGDEGPGVAKVIDDGADPVAQLTSELNDPTNVSPIIVDIEFSEPVLGFSSEDLEVLGAELVSVTGSGTSYSAELLPEVGSTASVEAKVIDAAVIDAFGNENLASEVFSIRFDQVAPQGVMTSSLQSPTSEGAIPLDIVFDEDVVDFDASDLAVSGASIGTFTGSGASFSAELIPSSDGTIAVNIAAGAARDQASNPSQAFAAFSIVSDRTAPEIALTTEISSPTNLDTIPITVSLTEIVSGFDESDVIVVNGTVSGFSGSGTSFAFDIVSPSGTIEVSVGAGAGVDLAGNPSLESNLITIDYDDVAPSATLDTSVSSPTNKSVIPVSLSFSEPVTGLDLSDFAVSGASIGNLSGQGASYGFDILNPTDNISVTLNPGAVSDLAGNAGTASNTLALEFDNTAPSAVISSSEPSPTSATTIPFSVVFSEPVSGFVESDLTVTNGVIANFSGSGTSYGFDIVSPSNPVVVGLAASKAFDLAGNGNTAAAPVTIEIEEEDLEEVTGDPEPLPFAVCDESFDFNATNLDPTIVPVFVDQVDFLYTGAGAVQQGVDVSKFTPSILSVARGQVLDDKGDPLEDVSISVLGAPEFGSTLSSAQCGQFALALNGGGVVTLNYTKAGYVSSQRTLGLGVNTIQWASDVILKKLDPKVTTLNLASQTEPLIARGRKVTDERGVRTATMLFPVGVSAKMILPNGSEQNLTTLNVRATEYTVGGKGPESMPAALPPNSAYTYAVELSVDEALAAGADAVEFDRNVYVYVDNFLGFPVGEAVPVGFYDRVKARWVPEINGRVIEIISIASNLASVDVDGDGVADTGTKLQELGIDAAELTKLATLYQDGNQLWRVGVDHFSPFDLNWPVPILPDGYIEPSGPDNDNLAFDPPDQDEQCTETGSTIYTEGQILGETIEIAGTPYSLNYSSARVPGRVDSFTLEVPTLPQDSDPRDIDGFLKTKVEIEVAGQINRFEIDPADLQNSANFVWDGRDSFGRRVANTVIPRVTIDHEYRVGWGRAFAPNLESRSFARPAQSGPPLVVAPIGAPSASVRRTWNDFSGLGVYDARNQKLGGWTIDVLHSLNPLARILHRGDGIDQSAGGQDTIQVVLADISDNSDLRRGSQAVLDLDGGMGAYTVAADGTIYFMLLVENDLIAKIWKLSPDGSLTHIAGSDTFVPNEQNEGSLAVNASIVPAFFPACFDFPAQFTFNNTLAVGPDGSVYFVECNGDFWPTGGPRIRKVDADGILTTVVGNGQTTEEYYLPDGELATEIPLGLSVGTIKVSRDGTLYFVNDSTGSRIGPRLSMVDASGRVATVAGAPNGPQVDGTPALEAFVLFNDFALRPNGEIYFIDLNTNLPGNQGQRNVIRKISVDGIISTIAGNGNVPNPLLDIDGMLATDIGVGAYSVDVTEDGVVFYTNPRRLIRVETDGKAYVVAGNGEDATQPIVPGSIPKQIPINFRDVDIACDPSGALYFNNMIAASFAATRLYKIDRAINSDNVVVSEDGLEGYVFSAEGRHLRTFDVQTKADIYSFTYDNQGLVSKIIDRNGLETQILRDASGDATSIVAPFGQTSDLSLSASGYLDEFVNAKGDRASIGYKLDSGGENTGLLASYTDFSGNTSTYEYDSAGLLVKAENPEGGFNAPSKVEENPRLVVELLTALNRKTTLISEQNSAGDTLRTAILPSGVQNTSVESEEELSRTSTLANGVIISEELGPDPRFGFGSTYVTLRSEQMPSGLELKTETTRTSLFSDPDDFLSYVALTEVTRINEDPDKEITTVSDILSQSVTVTTPEGYASSVVYDEFGQVVQSNSPGLFSVFTTYDSAGRISSIVQGSSAACSAGPDCRISSFTYDDNSFIDSATDPRNNTQLFSNDALGQVDTSTFPNGTQAFFSYDGNGNVTSISPPGRSAHGFGFDGNEQLETYTPPSVAGGGPTTNTYDLDRDIILSQLPGSRSISYTYDSAGRTAVVSIPRGTYTITYNPSSGQIDAIADPSGASLVYGFDGDLQTDTIWQNHFINGQSDSVGFEYNNEFNLSRILVNNANATDFNYDDDGVIIDAGALQLFRDPTTGLLASTQLNAGTSNIVTIYNRNGFGEATDVITERGTTALFEQIYTRDNAGNITRIVETVAGVTSTIDYSYDVNGRLASAISAGGGFPYGESYTYDPNGNRVAYAQGAASYDAQDRLLAVGPTTYSYEANGELRTKTAGSDVTSYQYDEFGNLMSVNLPTGAVIDYVVDGQNRRVGKRVNGALVQGLLYKDQLNPVAELDGTGAVRSIFVYGSKINVPDYMVRDGVTYQIVSDQLGSVRMVVDVATGNVVQKLTYDPWGKVLEDTSPGFQPFGYAGGIYDVDTELVRFGARDYDAAVGRWTSKDPILFSLGNPNVYSYTSVDPINNIDPTGLSEIVFDARGGFIEVYPGNSQLGPPIRFPASNRVRNPSENPFAPEGNGPAPAGRFPVGSIVNTGQGVNSAFGSAFFPIILPQSDPTGIFIGPQGRRGVGIHAGRADSPLGPGRAGTLGCIRTTENALDALRNDPPTFIDVRSR